MREIRFRMWDSFNAVYVFSNKTNKMDCLGAFFDYYDSVEAGGNNPILEQFTGLHDKNGVEIYDGDVVKLDDDVIGRIVYGGYYQKAGFGIETDHPLPFNDAPVTWDALGPEWAGAIEIIGNIHEIEQGE